MVFLFKFFIWYKKLFWEFIMTFDFSICKYLYEEFAVRRIVIVQ